MAIVKINEHSEKGKSLLSVLEKFKDQKNVLEFLSEKELEHLEDEYLAKEIDSARSYGYSDEKEIFRILNEK